MSLRRSDKFLLTLSVYTIIMDLHTQSEKEIVEICGRQSAHKTATETKRLNAESSITKRIGM